MHVDTYTYVVYLDNCQNRSQCCNRIENICDVIEVNTSLKQFSDQTCVIIISLFNLVKQCLKCYTVCCKVQLSPQRKCPALILLQVKSEVWQFFRTKICVFLHLIWRDKRASDLSDTFTKAELGNFLGLLVILLVKLIQS